MAMGMVVSLMWLIQFVVMELGLLEIERHC